MIERANIRIGTSGWHYRWHYKHWLDGFYPAGLQSAKMFPWYASHFSTVEINNTFYRLPKEDAIVHWRKLAPPGFLFSVKASRFITDMKRLLDPESSIENFFSRAELLGNTLGLILFQLAPKWRVNVDRLETLLTALPRKHQYVFEFRDASWAASPVYELLGSYNAAMCIHHWQGIPWPRELTADLRI